MVGIIVKKYEHFNRSMGKYITSRSHYEKEMAEGGYVPFEVAEKMAESYKARHEGGYNGISNKAMEVCKAAKSMADKKGNLRIGTRLQKAMENVGVSFDMSKLPKHYQEDLSKGGIE
jgi:hypothetical protein